jgi:hypothetical protein
MTRPDDFSLRDLYAALDAQRQQRGISWAQATREMNGQSSRASAHHLSSSTVTGTRIGATAEGDGVLQMLRWLNRSPESFVPGHPKSGESSARLPNIPSHKTLRFDTKKLHAALDAQRMEKKMSWAHLAKELRLSASMLTHLSKGGRTGFPHVMRMVGWLARPAAHFTRASDWRCMRSSEVFLAGSPCSYAGEASLQRREKALQHRLADGGIAPQTAPVLSPWGKKLLSLAQAGLAAWTPGADAPWGPRRPARSIFPVVGESVPLILFGPKAVIDLHQMLRARVALHASHHFDGLPLSLLVPLSLADLVIICLRISRGHEPFYHIFRESSPARWNPAKRSDARYTTQSTLKNQVPKRYLIENKGRLLHLIDILLQPLDAYFFW